MSRQTVKGFTLIELMIVVTIIAILALIAWPSYQTFIHKTRLEDARADLLTNARAIEKRYTKDHSFTGLSNKDLVADKSQNFYQIVFHNAPTDDTYTLFAVPTDGSNEYLSYNNEGELMLCVLGGTAAPTSNDECKAY